MKNNVKKQCITAITADSTTSESTRNRVLCAKPKNTNLKPITDGYSRPINMIVWTPLIDNLKLFYLKTYYYL